MGFVLECDRQNWAAIILTHAAQLDFAENPEELIVCTTDPAET